MRIYNSLNLFYNYRYRNIIGVKFPQLANGGFMKYYSVYPHKCICWR